MVCGGSYRHSHTVNYAYPEHHTYAKAFSNSNAHPATAAESNSDRAAKRDPDRYAATVHYENAVGDSHPDTQCDADTDHANPKHYACTINYADRAPLGNPDHYADRDSTSDGDTGLLLLCCGPTGRNRR